MNISKALAIPGWMEPAELTWLAEQAQKHSRIVEIGSFKGRSTVALAANTPGVVVAVDDFYGPRETEINDRASVYDQFLTNTAEFPNIVVLRCNHKDSPDPGFVPDMVFIDGGHEYENVSRDIAYWKPRLVKGGLLCGHDYGWAPGVDNAVNELLPDAQVVSGTSIWFQKL